MMQRRVIHYITGDERKILMTCKLPVRKGIPSQVIVGCDFILFDQAADESGSDKSGPAGYEYSFACNIPVFPDSS